MQYGQYIKTGTSLVTILVCSIGVVFLQKTNLKQQEVATDKSTYFEQEKNQASFARIQQNLPGFGFDNLVADWNYLQFVQYFGDAEAREVTGYSLVTDYFEVAVDKDPLFTQSFLSFSAANSLFAGQPKKTIELLDTVLETATPNLPGYPFLLWTYKATDEILFLGDIKAAKNSYKKAAEWASTRDDDIGKTMTNRYMDTVKFLASNPDSSNAQVAAWMTILEQAPDTKTQQHAINELKTLGVDISINEEGKMKVTRKERV